MSDSHRVRRGRLKGPRGKNYPVWQYSASKVRVSPIDSLRRVTGPKAKNRRLGSKFSSNSTVAVKTSRRSKLKALGFKNYKPWRG